MKKVLISMMFLLAGVLVCHADEPQKFSPEKFHRHAFRNMGQGFRQNQSRQK